MKILASATANRICTCLSLCVDWTVWSLGPILIASAVTLITLCATVFYTIILPYEYGTLASGDSPNTPPAAGRTYPLSYYVQIALSMYILLLTAFNYACVVVTHAGTTDGLRRNHDSAPPHEHAILMSPDPSPVPLRTCRKCHGPKPERTHHCSICKRCIKRLDHHWPMRGPLQPPVLLPLHVLPAALRAVLLRGGAAHVLDGVCGPRCHEYRVAGSWMGRAVSVLVLAGGGYQRGAGPAAQTTIEFYENQYQRKAARARGEAFFNEYDLGRRRNVAIFFNIGKRYKWWTMLLPIRVPPLGDGTTWLTGRKLASRDFELDGSEFKDHIMPI
ncbi:hypothetical protein SeLEV6574_g04700 [Synchytrium endobioticum]|uniref:Palmitoyltransferase n=1 Tax=Synchytrium endobioticum TaxID=286115 RepID=A0A507CY23_9FUNG|nr:hypothetical protein SeLEV6574_g04700 [Synchytrium endobioticum]